ncbi:hypothetical protein RUM43_003719 [Polyplax serrata]|uniref:Uncharacterized protein n=1 Tax=Polyplax serrata TaxID=468196 RepID=A0AAN8Q1N5_POLSC
MGKETLAHCGQSVVNQIKQTGWSQLSDRACTGDGGSLSNCHPPSEDDVASGKISSEEISKVGICRLEEQFFTLQSKYDEQIKKLEMQNFKLMEELKIRQKEFEKDDVGIKQDTFQFDKLKHLVDLPDSGGVTPPSNTEKEIDQTVLLGNNKASGRPQADNKIEQRNQFPVVLKEAFSQTETKHQNAGVQCAQYTCNCSLKETTVDLKKNNVGA